MMAGAVIGGPSRSIGPWGTPRTCAVLGQLGAALYVYLLVEVVIGDLDRGGSFVSELSALDQPHHLLFQAFDIGAGTLIAALGVGLAGVRPDDDDVRRGGEGAPRSGGEGAPRRAGPAGRLWTAGSRCLVGFGLSTVTVGLLPLDCAASASRACLLSERSGQVSTVHQAHSVASVLTTLTVLAAVALLGRASRGRPGWRPVFWASAVALPVVIVISVMLAVLGLGWGVGESATAAARLRALLGHGQRLELLVIAGWITVLSTCLFRAGRPPR